MEEKMLRTIFSWVLLLLLLFVPQGAQASSSTFTSIDYPGMTATVSQDINDRGQIGGYYSDSFDNPADCFHGIFATPVSELITMLLVGSVLIRLWEGRRKFRK
jgi:hypothetical protein